MIILKFGGSSLADPECVKRVASIVKRAANRKLVVVVSALGKTTDRLVAVAQAAVESDVEAQIEALRADHLEISARVVAGPDLSQSTAFLGDCFEELQQHCKDISACGTLTPTMSDAVLSLGERMSSYIVALALRSHGLDAVSFDSREVIVTDDRHSEACPLFDPTNQRLQSYVRPLVEQEKVPVLGGFIASTEGGVTSTLGRGGSDYTASIVGAALNAQEVQIWTDVDGVMTADPSLVEEAHRIRRMSFAEASELAYFGARVLHPSTMAPALENEIPIRVLNSRRPEIEGTVITRELPKTDAVAKSIAYKEGITIVDIRSMRMLMAHGFLARIFNVFEEHGTAVDMVTTSEVSVSLTVDRTDQLDAIAGKLSEVAQVELRRNQAIVCIVGEGIRHAHGISAKIFSALEGIHIAMISVGASRLNVSFVVDEADLSEAVSRLHRMLFAEIDPEVFA